MTITFSRYIEPAREAVVADGKGSPKPPSHVWHAADPPFKGYQPLPTDGYHQSTSLDAVVIDNGT